MSWSITACRAARDCKPRDEEFGCRTATHALHRVSTHSSWFQRYLLHGFAFKAVVIGGGYATGRELAEFFIPSGPWGGIFAMLLAMTVWSVVCVVTFLFSR